MFCRKSSKQPRDKDEVTKAIKLEEKSNVSSFEREPKPVQKLTLEKLKALAK